MTTLFDYPRDANLATIGPALLFVNVDWCGWCKRAKPVLERVSGITGTVVPVFSVNGDARPELAKQLGVQSYPTIIYVAKGGKRYVYTGDRTVDAIVAFVCNNSASKGQFCRRVV